MTYVILILQQSIFCPAFHSFSTESHTEGAKVGQERHKEYRNSENFSTLMK